MIYKIIINEVNYFLLSFLSCNFSSFLFFSFLFRRRPNVASTSTLLSVSQKIHTPRALPPAQCLPVPPLIVVPDVQNGKKKMIVKFIFLFYFVYFYRKIFFLWFFDDIFFFQHLESFAIYKA